MKKLNFYIFLFLFIFKIVKSSNALTFTLQFFYDNNLNPSLSMLNDIYKIYLYSFTKIGEPELIIKTLFPIENRYFSIYPKKESLSLEKEKLTNYYNESKSNTFQNISFLDNYYIFSNKVIAAKEKFIFDAYNLEKHNNSIINIFF